KQQDAAKGPKHVLKEVRTLDSTLPRAQARKLTTLAHIRAKIDRHKELLSDDERREAEAWRPPEWLRPLTVDDLPRQVREAFAEGPRVTKAALIGVTLLVLVLFGLRGAPPVLVSLGIGIVWMLGLAGQMKLKINFMNFVALPITLGVGADYAANIWARLRSDGIDKITPVIADTGSAVALCSLTTIIGYSSLLMSHNRALRSFGLLADIGEV